MIPLGNNFTFFRVMYLKTVSSTWMWKTRRRNYESSGTYQAYGTYENRSHTNNRSPDINGSHNPKFEYSQLQHQSSLLLTLLDNMHRKSFQLVFGHKV